MVKRTYSVSAIWDEEAQVFISQSDIDGFHIEAETLDEFEEIMRDTAVELIMANHVTPADIASTPVRDLVPAIIWNRPPEVAVA